MIKIKPFQIAIFSLIMNIAYSIYNIALGTTTHSWWFITVGVYYSILGLMRFAVLRTRKKRVKKNLQTFTGIMLVLTSLPLAGMVILSSIKDRGVVHHEIVMITIALYTFIKITLATINLVKARGKRASVTISTLRHITFADAAVSIYSLQMSMLVSFEGMTESDIRIFNIVVGSTVCFIVFLVGLALLGVKIQKLKTKSLKKQSAKHKMKTENRIL